MITIDISGQQPVKRERNKNGLWEPGVCGNPKGRPKTKAAPPKSLSDQLAAAMFEQIPIVDAQGKRKMMPAYDAIPLSLVRSFPTLKPKDQLAALKYMNELQVFDAMLNAAGLGPRCLSAYEARERLRGYVADLKEKYGAASPAEQSGVPE